MARQVVIEGLVVFGLGILSIVEGIRLNVVERIQMYDVLGPGNYNIGVGLLLILVSAIFLFSFRKEQKEKGERERGNVEERVSKKKMTALFVILGVYIALIDVAGYLPATLIFFVLTNRLVGFKSWLLNLGMSAGISAAFYVVFVAELDMIFPRGILLEWMGAGRF